MDIDVSLTDTATHHGNISCQSCCCSSRFLPSSGAVAGGRAVASAMVIGACHRRLLHQHAGQRRGFAAQPALRNTVLLLRRRQTAGSRHRVVACGAIVGDTPAVCVALTVRRACEGKERGSAECDVASMLRRVFGARASTGRDSPFPGGGRPVPEGSEARHTPLCEPAHLVRPLARILHPITRDSPLSGRCLCQGSAARIALASR